MNEQIVIIDRKTVILTADSIISRLSGSDKSDHKIVICVLGLSDAFCAKVVRDITLQFEKKHFVSYCHVPLSLFKKSYDAKNGVVYVQVDNDALREHINKLPDVAVVILHGSIIPLTSTRATVDSFFENFEQIYLFTRPSGSFLKRSFSKLREHISPSSKATAPSIGSGPLHTVLLKLAKSSPDAVARYQDDKLKLMYKNYLSENSIVKVVVSAEIEAEIDLNKVG